MQKIKDIEDEVRCLSLSFFVVFLLCETEKFSVQIRLVNEKMEEVKDTGIFFSCLIVFLDI